MSTSTSTASTATSTASTATAVTTVANHDNGTQSKDEASEARTRVGVVGEVAYGGGGGAGGGAGGAVTSVTVTGREALAGFQRQLLELLYRMDDIVVRGGDMDKKSAAAPPVPFQDDAIADDDTTETAAAAPYSKSTRASTAETEQKALANLVGPLARERDEWKKRAIEAESALVDSRKTEFELRSEREALLGEVASTKAELVLTRSVAEEKDRQAIRLPLLEKDLAVAQERLRAALAEIDSLKKDVHDHKARLDESNTKMLTMLGKVESTKAAHHAEKKKAAMALEWIRESSRERDDVEGDDACRNCREEGRKWCDCVRSRAIRSRTVWCGDCDDDLRYKVRMTSRFDLASRTGADLLRVLWETIEE